VPQSDYLNETSGFVAELGLSTHLCCPEKSSPADCADCPLMAICMVIVGAMWSFVSIIRRSL
jgi:hypothetical protein